MTEVKQYWRKMADRVLLDVASTAMASLRTAREEVVDDVFQATRRTFVRRRNLPGGTGKILWSRAMEGIIVRPQRVQCCSM